MPLLETFANASRRGYVSGAAPEILGDFELIQTITLSGDGVTEFSSIPQTYKHLQLRGSYRDTRAAQYGRLWMQVNGNGSAIYYVNNFQSSGAATSNATAYRTDGDFGVGNTANSGWFTTINITFQNYTSTTSGKTIDAYVGSVSNTGGGGGLPGYLGGYWNSTAAISNIRFAGTLNNNLLSGSRMSLYGIKG